MDLKSGLILVFFMALVTFLCRAVPILVLGNRPILGSFRAWLAYVPPCVLCAMLIPQILTEGGGPVHIGDNLLLLASLPSLWVGIRYKNICLTVVSGMLTLALLRVF